MFQSWDTETMRKNVNLSCIAQNHSSVTTDDIEIFGL